MFKHLHILVPIVFIDFLISTAMIFCYQESVLLLLAINSTVRPFCLGLILLIVSYIVDFFLSDHSLLFYLSLFVLSYVSIILLIFFGKESKTNLSETIIDLHSEWLLFSYVFFPYIISFFLVASFQLYRNNR